MRVGQTPARLPARQTPHRVKGGASLGRIRPAPFRPCLARYRKIPAVPPAQLKVVPMKHPPAALDVDPQSCIPAPPHLSARAAALWSQYAQPDRGNAWLALLRSSSKPSTGRTKQRPCSPPKGSPLSRPAPGSRTFTQQSALRRTPEANSRAFCGSSASTWMNARELIAFSVRRGPSYLPWALRTLHTTSCHWQRPSPLFRDSPLFRKHRMEGVIPILVQVQRQRHRPNQALFDTPRFPARQPGDESILIEPFA